MADAAAFAGDDARWRAVTERDPRANGAFCYGVLTTGRYSRPSCVARTARRENVVFFPTVWAARSAGYRPCGRCRPDEPALADHHAAAVAQACAVIADSVDHRPDELPTLDQLASAAGFSRFHFHRVFRSVTGLTPHAYLDGARGRRVRRELMLGRPVSEAIYSAGFGSSGRFYAQSARILGMTPTCFRAGGPGTVIRSVTGESFLGPALVAVTAQGVCAVLTDDDPAALRRRLAGAFPRAEILDGAAAGPGLDAALRRVLHQQALPGRGQRLLPPDVQAIAYEERVRRAAARPAPVRAGVTDPLGTGSGSPLPAPRRDRVAGPR